MKCQIKFRHAIILALALLLTACEKSLYVMHINDVYRINGVEEGEKGSFARLRTLRSELEEDHEVLMLHGGDFLFPSLESRITDGAHMIKVMNLLDGSDLRDERFLVTMGNHEFDQDGADEAHILQARIDESQFDWLNGNVVWKLEAGKPLISAKNLKPYVTRMVGGIKVGVFGLTINSKLPGYAETIDPDYIARAQVMSKHLRASGHDVVIALTHLRMSDDVKVLIAAGEDGPDIIFGGHEHNRQCAAVGNRLVVKADADARTAAVAKISLRTSGNVKTTFRYVPLDGDIGKDAAMLAELKNIGAEFDVDFCRKSRMPEGCLEVELGKTNVVLEGEELKIRKHETNLGNFIADQALVAYPDAQISFLNSGAIRLNQDIAAGAVLRERHLREIFQYPGVLYEIEITGETLQKVVDHAVEDWPGNGWWLQISGFRYSHYPDAQGDKARQLQILEAGVYRDVLSDEKIRAVTNGYLLAYPRKSDQDGYVMLNASQIVGPIPEKAPTMVAQTRLAIALMDEGIAPALEGRIPCVGKSCRDVAESSCTQFETLELSFN